MAWVDASRTRQRKQHTVDAVEELLPAAPRQVGAANAAVEEHITVKQETLGWLKETDMAWSMTRGVQHAKAEHAYSELVSIVEIEIRRRACHCCHTEPGRPARGMEQSFVERVDGKGCTRRFHHGSIGIGVVEVAVSIEDISDGQTVALNRTKDPLRMAARIYDGPLLGFFAADDVAIGLDQANL